MVARRVTARRLVLGALVVGTAVVGWRTSSLASTIELLAVLGVLLGLAVAFGGGEPRRRRALTPPSRCEPDARTNSAAVAALDGLDSIEHRSIELGAPWPRLVVGPTGAAVVDVCSLPGPVTVGADGVRGHDGLERCPRCAASARIARSLRTVLETEGIAAPVRFVAVVARDTPVLLGLDAPGDVTAVPVDGLADVLARGPVLPMGTVERVFAALARSAATSRGLVRG